MSFIVNNVLWRVKLVPPQHYMLKRANGTITLGSCDNNIKTIYVNNMLNDFMMKKVLCHEITHAVISSYNIILTDDQEELLADLIATYGIEIVNNANNIFKKIMGIAI